jgi:hypothetical protein
VSSSSTSSFELGPHERVRLGRLPAAALAFVLLVVAVEAVAAATEQWFAGPYSWHWQTKRRLLDRGALNGDVAVFGTSVLFFGLDPAIADQNVGGGRVVNLALDGMTLSQEVQLFRERARSSSRPQVAVLEFRELVVTQDTWFSFPYFRFWASWPDVLESRFYYWNLPIGLSYLENRVSTAFRHRVSLSSWLVESAKARRPAERIYWRNQGISDLMAEHAGWSRPAVEDAVFDRPNHRPRPWRVNRRGELWLRYFMQIAVDHSIRVVLLVPPSPPTFVELPGPEGFRARLNAQVSRLREEFPALPLEVFELTGYALDDFSDEIHVSPKGRRKMSTEFATWIAAYRQRYGLR